MVAASVPNNAEFDGVSLDIRQEFIVDRRGRLRQAGTVDPHQGFVGDQR